MDDILGLAYRRILNFTHHISPTSNRKQGEYRGEKGIRNKKESGDDAIICLDVPTNLACRRWPDRTGRKPKLESEKIDNSTWAMACWISRYFYINIFYSFDS